MDFAYAPEDEAFRAELQAWLDTNLPDFAQQGEIGDEHGDQTTPHHGPSAGLAARLHEGRWAAINWPDRMGRPRGHHHAERRSTPR